MTEPTYTEINFLIDLKKFIDQNRDKISEELLNKIVTNKILAYFDKMGKQKQHEF